MDGNCCRHPDNKKTGLYYLNSLPESEGGSSCKEHRLRFGFRLLEEAEEGVIFNTDLPEDFTTVPAGHQELQSVLI